MSGNARYLVIIQSITLPIKTTFLFCVIYFLKSCVVCKMSWKHMRQAKSEISSLTMVSPKHFAKNFSVLLSNPLLQLPTQPSPAPYHLHTNHRHTYVICFFFYNVSWTCYRLPASRRKHVLQQGLTYYCWFLI